VPDLDRPGGRGFGLHHRKSQSQQRPLNDFTPTPQCTSHQTVFLIDQVEEALAYITEKVKASKEG
jgi:hypothetical protein